MNRSFHFFMSSMFMLMCGFNLGSQNLIMSPAMDTMICENQQVLFAADTTSLGPNRTISWLVNGDLKSDSLSFSTTFSSVGNNLVEFTVDTLNGEIKDSVEVTVLVPDSPVVDENSVSDCSNERTRLTVDSMPNLSYVWMYDNRIIHTGSSYTPDTFGQGTYTLSIFARQNNCYSKDPAQIDYEVRPSPSIALTFEDDSGNNINDGKVCEGDDLRIKAFAIGGSDFTYNWNDGESFESFIDYDTEVAREGEINVTVENMQNCKNELDTLFYVFENPEVNYGRIDGREFTYGLFKGDSLKIQLDIENFVIDSVFSGIINWGKGAVEPQTDSVNQKNRQETYTKVYNDTSSNTEITLELVSSQGCIFQDETQSFSVIQPGALTSVLRVPKQIYCQGEIVSLDGIQSESEDCEVNSEIDEFYFEYSLDEDSWELINDDFTENVTNFDLNELPPNTTTVYFRLRVIQDCPGQQQLTSIDEVQIEIENFEVERIELCENIDMDQGDNLNDLFSMDGNFRTVSNLISVDTSNVYSTAEVGQDESLFLEFTSSNNCTYSDIAEVVIKDVPEPQLSWVENAICHGLDTVVELLNTEQYVSWEWEFNDIILEDSVLLDLQGLASGNYRGRVQTQFPIESVQCESVDSFTLEVKPQTPLNIQAIDSCEKAIYSVVDAESSANYIWSAEPGVEILGPASGSIVRVLGTGSLAVELISGCGGQDTIFVNSEQTTFVELDTVDSREIYQRSCNGTILLVFAEEQCGIQWGYYDEDKTVFPLDSELPYLEVSEQQYFDRTYFAHVYNCSGSCVSEVVDFRFIEGDMTYCHNKEGAIAVYPNPASERLQLELTNLAAGTYLCRLINSVGVEVQKAAFQLEDFTEKKSESIILNPMTPGYYILQISNGQGLLESHSIIILK